jgi:hypothetical protein
VSIKKDVTGTPLKFDGIVDINLGIFIWTQGSPELFASFVADVIYFSIHNGKLFPDSGGETPKNQSQGE